LSRREHNLHSKPFSVLQIYHALRHVGELHRSFVKRNVLMSQKLTLWFAQARSVQNKPRNPRCTDGLHNCFTLRNKFVTSFNKLRHNYDRASRQLQYSVIYFLLPIVCLHVKKVSQYLLKSK